MQNAASLCPLMPILMPNCLQFRQPEACIVTGNKVKLRNRKLADAQDDYAWQTDPELARLDATLPITTTFSRYLSAYASELCYTSSSRRSFAIDTTDGEHIGNCGYYNIDEAKGEAELGIMIGNRDYWDKGYGAATVTTLVSHIFHWTNLNRIYLKTLSWNSRAQRCFQKCGFISYGYLARDGLSFVLMEIHRKRCQER
jgi:RimJ/RimL family protein N-acetyltransferase